MKKRIQSLQKLIEFFRPIPAKKWCSLTRENALGQRCALGHLDQATPPQRDRLYSSLSIGLNLPRFGCHGAEQALATANNGMAYNCGPDPKAKTRTIAFLRTKLKALTK